MKVLRRIAEWMALAAYLYAAVSVLFFHLSEGKGIGFDLTGRRFASDALPNLAWMAIGALALFLFLRMMPKAEGRLSRGAEMVLLALILLLIQSVVLYGTWHLRGADCANLRQAAQYFTEGRPDAFYNGFYLVQAPNQLAVYLIYLAAYRIGTVIPVNPDLLLAVLAMLTANLSVVLASDAVWRITGSRAKARLTFVICAALYGVSFWMSVPYTDMLSAPVPVAALDLWLVMRHKKIPVFFRCLICGVIPALFYHLKALNAIILIAIVAAEIVSGGNETSRRAGGRRDAESFLQMAAALLACLVLSHTLAAGMQRYTGIQKDPTVTRGIGWYLLLGSSEKTYGMYSLADQRLTEQLTSEGKQQTKEELPLVRSRIQKMGAAGMIRHWKNKSLVFFADGTFGSWLGAGIIDGIPKATPLRRALRSVFWPSSDYGLNTRGDWKIGDHLGYDGSGAHYFAYACFLQGLWLGIFFWLGIAMIPGRVNRRGSGRTAAQNRVLGREDTPLVALRIMWLGVFLFAMLFETNARLLISYLPPFAVMAVSAIPGRSVRRGAR